MKKIIKIFCMVALFFGVMMGCTLLMHQTETKAADAYVAGNGSTPVKVGDYYYKQTNKGIYRCKTKAGEYKKIVKYEHDYKSAKSSGYLVNGSWIFYTVSSKTTVDGAVRDRGIIYKVKVNGKSKSTVRKCNYAVKLLHYYGRNLTFYYLVSGDTWPTSRAMYTFNIDTRELFKTAKGYPVGLTILKTYGPILCFKWTEKHIDSKYYYEIKAYNVVTHKSYFYDFVEGNYVINENYIYYVPSNESFEAGNAKRLTTKVLRVNLNTGAVKELTEEFTTTAVENLSTGRLVYVRAYKNKKNKWVEARYKYIFKTGENYAL